MTVISQIKSLFFGSIFLTAGFASLPLAALSLIFKGRPFDIFNKSKLSQANFTFLWSIVGKPSAADEKLTNKTISQAHGVVLDLGPGTGFTVHHFDKSKITKVFGIEPNTAFHPALQAAIDAAGLTNIYTIVGTGVEDSETLKKFGIEEGSADTIVACKVLCSIPDPKATIAELYKLLAPGGQFLVLEHIKAKGGIGGIAQRLANMVWPFLMAGCELCRPTEAYLYGAGEWEVKDLQYPEGISGNEFITFIQGKLIKAK
ncbi:hypothetical protein TWF106_009383 [Orbilia oligospora]|uniref:Methyltransferase type 11 domain-containing protein n=1 Tax=Orbilia oligospora TaxID=2813651 RepID=A0A6G1MBP8_ORBOL|nr:hypothetical protein TWF191_000949 [Orbilia oligospora]KAF3213724.1 hypothetical protein TWF106_009383 [Orbilia oligospora]KAF3218979.1 hypothetical protein TWF679_000390 [Orbilia oligospora]KAF3251412.1 hypothetical protein TWF192_004908 [Orbilia oligospora]